MKKRSGDLHQHDADGDDEGTLWCSNIEYVYCEFMCKDEHNGLDENTPAAMLWSGKVLKISPDFFVSLERNGPLEWTWLLIIHY